MSSSRDFDLIIFSATSFVGYFVIRELLLSIEQNPTEYSHLKWAVAGRNSAKIVHVLSKLSVELAKDLTTIPIILADITDPSSLLQLTTQTVLLVNTVGPYRLYGKPVIECCLESQTHYIDLSAEIQFNEQLQIDFHKAAELKNILVISCCGWGSVPVDLGVAYLKKHFDGHLSSVEVFGDVKPGPKGYKLHTGTFDSMLNVYVEYNKLPAIREQLYGLILPSTVPYIGPKLTTHKILLPPSSPHIYIQFPGPDSSVVKRTQFYNYQKFQEPPVQIQTYFRLRPVLNQLLGFPLITSLFWFKKGRQLLNRHIECCTAGFISSDGPTREQINETSFTFKLVGRGFTDESNKRNKCNKTMKLVISGNEPAYLATSTFIVQAGLCLLMEDGDKMPRGGVLTPASVFQNTNLIERLQNRGINFTFK